MVELIADLFITYWSILQDHVEPELLIAPDEHVSQYNPSCCSPHRTVMAFHTINQHLKHLIVWVPYKENLFYTMPQ
jgi:hypothetical protein